MGAELGDRDLGTELLGKKGHVRCQQVALGGAVGNRQIDRLEVEKNNQGKTCSLLPQAAF